MFYPRCISLMLRKYIFFCELFKHKKTAEFGFSAVLLFQFLKSDQFQVSRQHFRCTRSAGTIANRIRAHLSGYIVEKF